MGMGSASQIETIRLYEANLEHLLEMSKRTDGWLLSSVLLALAWCLTSKSSQVRLDALRLVQKFNEKLAQDENTSCWSQFLRKLLKHKEEIEMDGGDYIRTKLNKIMTSDDKLASSIIDHLKKFLNASLKNSGISGRPNSPRPQHLAQFSSNLDSSCDLDIKCLVLIKFKHILLHLFEFVNDNFKLKLAESIFSLLVTILNESSSLVESAPSDRLGLELRLNKALLSLIVRPYLLNSKSFSFFNKNDKYFDYLVGYLNNTNQVFCVFSGFLSKRNFEFNLFRKNLPNC